MSKTIKEFKLGDFLETKFKESTDKKGAKEEN